MRNQSSRGPNPTRPADPPPAGPAKRQVSLRNWGSPYDGFRSSVQLRLSSQPPTATSGPAEGGRQCRYMGTSRVFRSDPRYSRPSRGTRSRRSSPHAIGRRRPSWSPSRVRSTRPTTACLARYVESQVAGSTRLELDLRLVDFFGTAGFAALHNVNVICRRYQVTLDAAGGQAAATSSGDLRSRRQPAARGAAVSPR